MRKINLLLATSIASTIVLGASGDSATLDISVGATLVKPITITKSSADLVGQSLGGVSGIFNLTPINIGITGDSDSIVNFTTPQYVTLTESSSSNTIVLSTKITGGTVTSNGSDINSEVVLSSSGVTNLVMGGNVSLTGVESSGLYSGSADIDIIYN